MTPEPTAEPGNGEAANHSGIDSKHGAEESKLEMPAAKPESPAVDFYPLEPEPDSGAI